MLAKQEFRQTLLDLEVPVLDAESNSVMILAAVCESTGGGIEVSARLDAPL